MKLTGIYMMAVLLVGSVYDWKYYSLPIWLLLSGILGGVGGLLYGLLWGDTTFVRGLTALFPGVIALILAYITGEQIGYGDGVLLLAMGGCMGDEGTIVALFGALAASFVVSIVMVVSGKAGRKHRLPFVPFLFMGSIMAWGGGWLLG